jgi:hypothetical protein
MQGIEDDAAQMASMEDVRLADYLRQIIMNTLVS